MDLYSSGEFHDFAEYFHVHLGRTEKSHVEDAIIIAARNCSSLEDLENIKFVYYKQLDLLADFWNSIVPK